MKYVSHIAARNENVFITVKCGFLNMKERTAFKRERFSIIWKWLDTGEYISQYDSITLDRMIDEVEIKSRKLEELKIAQQRFNELKNKQQ